MQEKQLLELSRTLADSRSWNIDSKHAQADNQSTAAGTFDRNMHTSSTVQPSMKQSPISLSVLESMQNHEKPVGFKLGKFVKHALTNSLCCTCSIVIKCKS